MNPDYSPFGFAIGAIALLTIEAIACLFGIAVWLAFWVAL